VAAPGCYVTTAVLALAPLLRDGLVEPTGIVVDAASGVSGAGRPPKPTTTFCAVDETFTAYSLLDHRHTPEIEQGLTDVAGAAVQVLFTPHLAPMNRGILATCYARPTGTLTTDDALAALRKAWADEPFVVVVDGSPSTKATLGSNAVHVTARADERTGWVVAIAALDNLTKGASGQAIQCANLMLALPEATGLPTAGLYP
jgi:N-acetyl-gamma-glutamyl-phosphate reductase